MATGTSTKPANRHVNFLCGPALQPSGRPPTLLRALSTCSLGRWTAKHDDPSIFSYHINTTIDDWRAFIRALDLAENKVRAEYKAKAEGNTGAWRVLVALEVDASRQQAGLVPVNTRWLAAALHEMDMQGRPIARADAAGKIVPIFYAPIKRYAKEEAAWGIP